MPHGGVGSSASVAINTAVNDVLPRATAQGLTRISYQTGWLAQAEHGGLYHAQATGIYKEHGLDVEIRPGGPQVNVMQLFMAGTCDFADADSFRTFAFAQDKLPAVAIAAFFQKDPRVLMSHPGTGNDTLAALKGLGRPVVLIAGGLGKGQDFTPLAPAVRAHARAVLLIGQDGPLIGRALADCGVPLQSCGSLEDAVARGLELAQPGDAVLLSPACASMDMFRNYAHRSACFIEAVRELAAERGEIV